MQAFLGCARRCFGQHQLDLGQVKHDASQDSNMGLHDVQAEHTTWKSKGPQSFAAI